ncbi:uncharacterized protein N7458_000936 [Penicillium daleae]|uniref:FAD-binding PCMH-type domain-containing protein n=1 Tax=Penicillium daleae TaxID=63821 RepID=A0AAD6G8A7_9EURO|nr:uncharacterized protein N7458_000936 [Penicillium daleae]KAJ5465250.1 hypothetical protein N7458_000936 [Penicillium daleae]
MTHDAAECANLRDQWLYAPIHYSSSSSVMAPLFANQSCDPFQPPAGPCILGNYVRYAVNATGTSDVVSALAFAEEHNIRFVIRNTGHDFQGRSTGAGTLSVCTHNMKRIKVLDWNDAYYNGKALTVGAGVQGFDALEVAHAAGLTVVSGECPTVGLAGGYTQGGGHSALSTVFGLGPDNTLSFDVVTPTGQLITASRTENQDLYWALSGGGSGNYGIVISMTVRAHPDSRVSGAEFTISASGDKLYDAVDAFHSALPNIVDSGVMVLYFFGEGFLQLSAMTAYNKTKAEAEQILQPFVNSLDNIGIALTPNFTEYPSYRQHYDHYWGPLPVGKTQVGNTLFGGRLIRRSVLPDFSPTSRKLIDMGVTFIGVGLNVSHFGLDNANAVLPQWRNSIVHAALTLPYSFQAPFESMVAQQDKITNEVQPVIEATTPGAGAYINEADFQQKDWQETFFGSNYPKLLEIKQKYDPNGLLYDRIAVGSEKWTVHTDGRMCRSGY